MAKTHNWSEPINTGKPRTIQIGPHTPTASMREAFRSALALQGIEMPKSSGGVVVAINSIYTKEV